MEIMKKMLFNSLRAIFVIILLFLAGCYNQQGSKNDGLFVIKVTINGDDVTRTSHSWSDEGLVTLWSGGDKISVLNDKTDDGNASSDFALVTGEGSVDGEFQGTLPASGDGDKYFVVYPAVENCCYDSVPFDMSAPQVHTELFEDMTHLAAHGIMYGDFLVNENTAETETVVFKHLTSAFKFNVILPEAAQVSLVQLRAKNPAEVPFIVKGTFDASSGKINERGLMHSNSLSVFMDCGEPSTEASALMMFVPAKIAGVALQAVVTAGGKAYVKEFSIPAGKEFESGVCYNLTLDCSLLTPSSAVTISTPGTLVNKLNGMVAVTDLKINTTPGVELSIADFKTIYNNKSLRSLDLSAIGNKTLPGNSGSSFFKNITSIILPESLEIIGDYAFCQSALTGNFLVPASVTKIGNYAFQNCVELNSVIFVDRTEPISAGAYTFEGCTGFTGEISLPAQLTCIGEFMFANCVNLSAVNFADFETPLAIGASAFQKCTSLVALTISAGISEIGRAAFSNCTNLKSLVFAERTNNITLGNNAFAGNSGMCGRLAIPETMTEIGNYAFNSCLYNGDLDKTAGLYFTALTPPALKGANALYRQRVFVATEELKAKYEADEVWRSVIANLAESKIHVGTIQ